MCLPVSSSQTSNEKSPACIFKEQTIKTKNEVGSTWSLLDYHCLVVGGLAMSSVNVL